MRINAELNQARMVENGKDTKKRCLAHSNETDRTGLPVKSLDVQNKMTPILFRGKVVFVIQRLQLFRRN